ncbi:MAG: class I SAM-dependent methyltransferase [Anaerolineaceae bacterium]
MSKVYRLKPIVPGHPFEKARHIPYYYAKSPIIRHYFYKRLDNVLSHLQPKKTNILDGIALDVGCFVGLVTISLLDTYKMAIGIDVDLEYLKMAKQLSEYENKHPAYFVKADVNHLPFKTDSLLAVTGASIFEHIPDIPDPYDEIKRVLKHDGIFVAGLPIEVGFSFLLKQIFFRIINWTRKDHISFSNVISSFTYGELHGPKWNTDHLDYNWKRTFSYIQTRFNVEKILFWPLNLLRGLFSVYVSILATEIRTSKKE